MINILNTKWIKIKKDLKQVIVKIKIDNMSYQLVITKKQDIKDFIENINQTKSTSKIIFKILWKWFLFNKKEFKKVQKYNYKINKILKNPVKKH